MDPNPSPPHPFLRNFIAIFATWFGCGKSPRGPGTVGTLGAIPLVWAFYRLGPMDYMLATVGLAVVAIFVAHFHEALSGKHDASEIVIDEVAGFLVTMTWVPFTWSYVLVGFVVFRILDIWKPYPISYIDKNIGGGVGVVADDLLAGILANIVLQILLQKGWL